MNRPALLLCVSMMLPTFAQAQMADVTCDDSARLITSLQDVSGAKRQGMGLRDPGTTLEVWVVERNGDWIIVQNYANGTSCIVAMGEHWEGSFTNPA